jgi:pimeloyl-ACP methyl ester carboxylesterase
MAGTVVLVHGAWHGAWCWERVTPGLSARGLRPIALDLPGHGADESGLTDLHGDAARVVETLDVLDEPALLVGHSYGGAVITEAGEHPMVEHLVFLAALALDAGESCADAAVGQAAANGIDWQGRPNLGDGLVVAPDGTIRVDPDVATRCLYNDCDAESVAWALDRLGPQPLGNMQQAPSRVSWRAKPSTYVVCTEDMAVHPDLQRLLAKRCSAAVEWPTGHSPFLSDPGRVVAYLAAAASA